MFKKVILLGVLISIVDARLKSARLSPIVGNASVRAFKEDQRESMKALDEHVLNSDIEAKPQQACYIDKNYVSTSNADLMMSPDFNLGEWLANTEKQIMEAEQKAASHSQASNLISYPDKVLNQNPNMIQSDNTTQKNTDLMMIPDFNLGEYLCDTEKRLQRANKSLDMKSDISFSLDQFFNHKSSDIQVYESNSDQALDMPVELLYNGSSNNELAKIYSLYVRYSVLPIDLQMMYMDQMIWFVSIMMGLMYNALDPMSVEFLLPMMNGNPIIGNPCVQFFHPTDYVTVSYIGC